MKPQSMLFTIYGEYVRHVGGEIWVGSLTKMLGEFGMNEPAVRAAISRMQRQGWLVSRKVGNRSYYSMSPRGQRRLNEAAVRIYKLGDNAQWNGRWCLVSYNIPEEVRSLRDQLRKELNFLGFGMLTTSTWISPNGLAEAVQEIAEGLEATQHVEIFTSDHVGYSDPKDLVQKCWNLDEISQAYREFIDDYRPAYAALRAKVERGDTIADSDCFVDKTQLVHRYRKFLFVDPDLPQELLPERWLGQEADRLFSAYYALLNPGATRYFDEVYEPAPDLVEHQEAEESR